VFPVVRILGFSATPPAKTEHLKPAAASDRSRAIPAGQPFKVNEIAFDILHRLAACAYQVMMRFQIAFYQQTAAGAT